VADDCSDGRQFLELPDKIVFPTLFVIFSATAFSYANFSTGYPAERTYSAERHAVAAPADDAGYTSSAHSDQAIGMHATNNRKADTTLAATDEESTPVLWTELSEVLGNESTGTLQKAHGFPSSQNSGAVSAERLGAGEDGWFEMTIEQTNRERTIGFSDGNSNNDYRTIDYALYLQNNSDLKVYESGTYRGTFGKYRVGDRLGIARQGDVVYYKKNGEILYVSTRASTGILMVDASLQQHDSKVSNVVMSRAKADPGVPASRAITISDVGTTSARISWTAGGGDGRLVILGVQDHRFPVDGQEYSDGGNVYGQGGALGTHHYVVFMGNGSSMVEVSGLAEGLTYNVQIIEYIEQGGLKDYQLSEFGTGSFTTARAEPFPVLWTELSEVLGNESTGTLQKVHGFPSSQNSGAVSAERLGAGEDGWFEMTIEQTNRVRTIGFSDGNSNNDYRTIDYALYLQNNSDLKVYESGTYRGTFGKYRVGDRLGIARQGDVVYYKKNGEILYVSTRASTGILMVDASLQQHDSKVSNVVMSRAKADPGVPASRAITISDVGTTSARISWTAGGGDGRLVILGVQDHRFPVDGQEYSDGGNVYGQGGALGTHHYVVFMGNGSSMVEVSGLAEGLTYNVQIIEYIEQGGLKDYQLSEFGTGSFTTARAEPFPVLWTELSEVLGNESTGTLQKVHGFPSSQNSGAVSAERLGAGEDGWFEMTIEQTNRVRTIGFSDGNSNNDYRTIDYALYLQNNSDLKVYESGTYRGTFGKYRVGDRLGIARQGDVVYYKKNGEILYVSTRASTGILMVDASLQQHDSKVSNVVMSRAKADPGVPASRAITISDVGTTSARISWTAGGGDGRLVILGVQDHRFPVDGQEYSDGGNVYGQGGALGTHHYVVFMGNGSSMVEVSGLAEGLTYNVQIIEYIEQGGLKDYQLSEFGTGSFTTARAEPFPVLWTELSEVLGNESTGTLQKVHGFPSSQNSGAVSAERLGAGEDGWFEMTIEQTNRVRTIGFSDGNSNNDYRTIDYALYLQNNSDLKVYESGTYRGTFGKYRVGDRLGIARQGDVVYYKKNGEILYVSTRASTGILMVDASLQQHDSKVSNVVMSRSFLTNDLYPDSLELQALTSLYESTDGENWFNRTNWLVGNSSIDFANWYGITVDNGDVVSIDLGGNGLFGSVSDEFAGLGRLNLLILSQNELFGSLPSELTNLNDFSSLDVENNGFTLNDLIELAEIELRVFQYKSQNPVDIAATHSVALGQSLTLVANIDRSVTPPCKYQWFKDGTPLTDAPTEDGHTYTITSMTAADAGSYHYTITHDRLPALTLISRVQEVVFLRPIQQSQKEALIAFYNSTDGDRWTNIPEEKRWKQEGQSGHEARNWEGITIDENGKVVQIDLQDKGLRGSVPEEISALSSLRVLDLSHNMLQGEVPVCLARLDNLEELYLNNNEFEGYMDLEFSVMPNIRVMALQHNDLVSIPDFSFNDYVDPAQVHLHAENNRLEFYYIENNLNGDGSDLLGAFTYMPQKVYGEPGTLGFVEGRELSLGMRMLGRTNHYQWQLSSDNGGSWTDLEGDAPEYIKSSVTEGDEGWYRVKITNDRVHRDDAEILSAILKVQVATAPVLVNRPIE
jgi:hypothetical protein